MHQIVAPPRELGAVNWLGVRTLYAKEVRRFMKVPAQTIVAPVVTQLLFLAVFALAFKSRVSGIGGLPFVEFLTPGLIMMAVIQNSFANSSSSLIIAKTQGNIVDVLMPPLSAAELTCAYTLGAATRGLVVAAVVAIAMLPFVRLRVVDWGALLYFAAATSLMLALVGVATGIWAEKFDHLATITNFVVTPLSFLSGTFYSIKQLPDFWHALSHFDPIFYAIDGFRAGFIGTADVSLLQGGLVLLAVDVALWVLCQQMFSRGYKLKG